LLNQFDAKPTFFDIALFLDDPDIIRAGCNAIFAPDAFILIHQDHAILSLVGGPGRANLYTGRVITMLALNG
jgi:hypothetical protein